MLDPREVELKLHHGVHVWEHVKTDPMRGEECLCLSCKEMKECPIAAILYNTCILGNVAVMITRCKSWKYKQKENDDG